MGHSDFEFHTVVFQVTVEHGLDHWPDIVFVIHEFDGFVEIKRVREDVGHRIDMVLLGIKDVDFYFILHEGGWLVRFKIVSVCD